MSKIKAILISICAIIAGFIIAAVSNWQATYKMCAIYIALGIGINLYFLLTKKPPETNTVAKTVLQQDAVAVEVAQAITKMDSVEDDEPADIADGRDGDDLCFRLRRSPKGKDVNAVSMAIALERELDRRRRHKHSILGKIRLNVRASDDGGYYKVTIREA